MQMRWPRPRGAIVRLYGQRSFARAIGTLLGLGLCSTSGQALAAGSVFIVGPDRDQYRLSEIAALDAQVRKASNDTALATANELDSVDGPEGVAVYIKDGPTAASLVAALRIAFAKNRGVNF